jgi:hypothetical protein
MFVLKKKPYGLNTRIVQLVCSYGPNTRMVWNIYKSMCHSEYLFLYISYQIKFWFQSKIVIILRKTIPGTVNNKDNLVTRFPKNHNHPPAPSEINTKKFMAHIKERAPTSPDWIKLWFILYIYNQQLLSNGLLHDKLVRLLLVCLPFCNDIELIWV